MPKLFTIGHSTHTLQEFIAMLHGHQIKHLVDIRTIPKSRHVPWFNENTLRAALHKEKITYTHLPELGGLGKTRKDSINQGWRNASFRGFADYMQTPEFYLALKKLNQLIKPKKNVAIMCAEAVPWRCHRSLSLQWLIEIKNPLRFIIHLILYNFLVNRSNLIKASGKLRRPKPSRK